MDAVPEHALHARFLRGLAAAPDRVAIRVGEEELTYAAAHERALRWAGALLDAAPEPPRAVGVLAGKGLTAYVGVLAALYTGAAVVPLQPDFPASRTRWMLAATGLSALITDARGQALLPELIGDGSGMTVLAPEAGPDPGSCALRAPLPVAAHDPAYVLFTSGSTGRPKGVPITHGNATHYFRLQDARYDFTPLDVFSQTFDLVFDCAMFDLFSAWGAGACAVGVPPEAYRDLPSFLAEGGLTVWFSTPSGIALIRRLGGLAPAAMPTLRWSLFAGEALRCRDAADWQRAAPGSVVENLYGPTELTITITAHRWHPETSPGLGAHGGVPIGAVHPGHRHLLLDAYGRPSSEDEGELCVSGPQLTPGYLDQEDGRGRFLRYDSRTWYRTGDRVRRNGNGELAYLGRTDTQVQVGGWRVELAEIDHALSACDGVEQAVAVDVPVDGVVELVAFYTGRPTAPAQLARGLRERLPGKLIPRRFEHLGDLPLTSNRKIDRSALRARAAQQTGTGPYRTRTGA